MADRNKNKHGSSSKPGRDKEKNKKADLTLALPSPKPSQLPAQSAAIALTNRFHSLENSNPVRPVAQSTLVTRPVALPTTIVNPLTFKQMAQQPPVRPSSQVVNPYAYHQPQSAHKGPIVDYIKAYPQNVFVIEPAHAHLSNPIDLVKAYLEPGWTFIPSDPEKTHSFYQDILFFSKSIFVKPINDKFNPEKVIYHSLIITRIISINEWGSHPSLLRDLPFHNRQFNYYDYKESWFKILLHQNEDYSHSWFLNFHKDFKSQIPAWFAQWWFMHDLIHEIFPADLQDQIITFSSVYKTSKHESQFPILLTFICRYKVPWILKWKWEIAGFNVVRQFYAKWWPRFQ